MPDVLHIVIVIEEVQHLFHVGDVLFLLQLLVILGDHLDLGGGEMVALGGEGVGHGVEVVENPDVDSLRAAVQSVYDAYPQYADYIARIQALLAE